MNTLTLFALFCVLAGVAGNVIDATIATFDQYVDGSSNVLVEFFAPWCGHCKNLAPEWKIAAETFQPADGVKFVAVDATENGALADKYGVKGYPTIKFFPKGSTEAQEYDGGRTADTIVKWVNSKTGTNRKVKVVPSAVVTLNSENFDNLVLGEKAALVEFYAPWCGHCKSLAPKYEKLASIFAGDSEVLVAKVDATEESELAQRYDVGGYPTIKFFPAGSSTPEDYQGGREVSDFVEFLNSKAGTQRTAEGGLAATVGRIAALDAYITAANYQVNAAVVEQINAAVAGFTGNDATYGKIYQSVAKNVVAKGADYVSKEQARVAKMLGGGSIKPESKKNFELRANILKAFSAEAAASKEEL